LIIKSEVQGIDLNTIVESRDVIFFEDLFPFKNKLKRYLLTVSFPSTRSQPTIISNPESASRLENELRKEKRVRKEKDFRYDFYTYSMEEGSLIFKDGKEKFVNL
jgi:hypothetical protein